MERDEFDDLQPVYILAYDEEESLVGTWRMLPTTGPNMLRDVFPGLLGEEPCPCDSRIWETSRFAVDAGDADTQSGLAAVSRATSEIFCGLVEFCITSGIEQIVTVYDVRIARLLPRIGCRPKWRSKAQRFGNSLALAGLFDINEQVLSSIQDAGGIVGSVIRCSPKIPIQKAA